MNSLQLGDIFEIKTTSGFRYAQYTHKNATFGELIRIFKRTHSEECRNIDEITNDEVEFTVFFPLSSPSKHNLIKKIGTASVSRSLADFPKFRSGTPHRDTKVVETWWIWDGKEEVYVGTSLSAEQKLYPRLGVLNLAAVQSLIEGTTHPSML